MLNLGLFSLDNQLGRGDGQGVEAAPKRRLWLNRYTLFDIYTFSVTVQTVNY